jgi:hypothetical protein
MSESNGTALSTSVDAAAGIVAAARSGGLGRWLARLDDTAPLDDTSNDDDLLAVSGRCKGCQSEVLAT